MNISSHNKKAPFLSDLDGTWLSGSPTNRKALQD